MSVEQSLRDFLEPRLPDYLELLREMVSINSFTANPVGVNRLGEFTAAAFAPLGFTAEYVQSAMPTFGRHVVLTRPGRSGRKIGLVSHLDTVFPPEEEVRNHFSWRPEGDRIYGPGTVDIKGGTVMIFMMLNALQAVAPEAFNDITWVVLLDASEEDEATDFGVLCRQRLGPDALACLVFEGGNLSDGKFLIVVARKGMVIYSVKAEGKASHAGSAHKEGANAIVQMAEVIRNIAALTDYERELTYNIGMISGGTVVNRVPHYAEIGVEMRAFTPTVFEEGMDSMMSLNGQTTIFSVNGDYPCKVSVEVARSTSPWPRNQATDRLFEIWQEAAVALNMRVLPEERGGLSDGNHIWDVIPTLDGLGPSGGNAHCSEHCDDGSKQQEYVTVSSFVPKAVLNCMALLKLISTV